MNALRTRDAGSHRWTGLQHNLAPPTGLSRLQQCQAHPPRMPHRVVCAAPCSPAPLLPNLCSLLLPRSPGARLHMVGCTRCTAAHGWLHTVHGCTWLAAHGAHAHQVRGCTWLAFLWSLHLDSTPVQRFCSYLTRPGAAPHQSCLHPDHSLT